MNTRSILPRAVVPLAAILVLGGVASGHQPKNPAAAAIQNPVAATPASIAAGRKAYDENCAGCHGNRAQGALKAGVAISIIEEQGGKQPPDLTDAQWDHGGTDGEIFAITRKGIPPTMMAGWEGRIPDTEIWSIVNYIRAVAANEDVAVASTPAVSGRGRVDVRFAEDSSGELYLLTKSDGMIRQVTALR